MVVVWVMVVPMVVMVVVVMIIVLTNIPIGSIIHTIHCGCELHDGSSKVGKVVCGGNSVAEIFPLDYGNNYHSPPYSQSFN